MLTRRYSSFVLSTDTPQDRLTFGAFEHILRIRLSKLENMKKKNLLLLAVCIGVVFVFSGNVSAQQRPLLGGYKAMASTDAGAIKAAKFAANAEAKRSEKEIEFISVVKAERQSVAASTNYRLCVKVSDSGAEGQDAADVFVKVIVNVDAKGSHKLLSYEASDCGEEEEEG
jgi:hypothetical protein